MRCNRRALHSPRRLAFFDSGPRSHERGYFSQVARYDFGCFEKYLKSESGRFLRSGIYNCKVRASPSARERADDPC